MFPADLLSEAADAARSPARAGPQAGDGGKLYRRLDRRAAHGDRRARPMSSSAGSSPTPTRPRPNCWALPEDLLARHGAVSEPVARAMVAGRAGAFARRCRRLGHRRCRARRRQPTPSRSGSCTSRPLRKGGDDPASGMPLRRHRPRTDPSRQRRGCASADLACGRRVRRRRSRARAPRRRSV